MPQVRPSAAEKIDSFKKCKKKKPTLEEIRQQRILPKLMWGGLRHQAGLLTPLERSLSGGGRERLDAWGCPAHEVWVRPAGRLVRLAGSCTTFGTLCLPDPGPGNPTFLVQLKLKQIAPSF